MRTSAIDCFDYTLMGFLDRIMIYRLNEDVDYLPEFRGKKGDILLGGGSGETSAMCISLEAFKWYGQQDPVFPENVEYVNFATAFWSPNESYYFIKFYKKNYKYNPKRHGSIESWLTEHIIAFLIKNYPEDYGQYVKGAYKSFLKYYGNFCRIPTVLERRFYRPIKQLSEDPLTEEEYRLLGFDLEEY